MSKCSGKNSHDAKRRKRQRKAKLISATIAADDEANHCDNRHNRRKLNSCRRRLGLPPVLFPKERERSLPPGTGYRVADDGFIELIDLEAVDDEEIDEDSDSDEDD